MKKEITIFEIGIFVLLSFIIGFFLGRIDFKSSKLQEIVIHQPIIKEIEKNECEYQCFGLTTEDVEAIVRREFVDALEFNYAVDGAMGEPRLVPLLKSICK